MISELRTPILALYRTVLARCCNITKELSSVVRVYIDVSLRIVQLGIYVIA